MKYSTTSVALIVAIVKATIVLSCHGKLKNAAATVNAVPSSSARKIVM